jgi:membrane-associated protease RseP (regulator of RpoE activity)
MWRCTYTGTGYDASGPTGIIQALLVLTSIVAFHELGHFTAARAQGIHVTKFAIGFGPKLFAVQATPRPIFAPLTAALPVNR